MASPTKKCNCRDDQGRKLGQKCPLLAKRDHGAWWVRYEAPPGPDGKRRRPWAGPYPTKTRAQEEATRLEARVSDGEPTADRTMRLSAYLDDWLERKRKTLKPSTYASYEEAVTLYYRPGLGHLRLHQVDEGRLESLYDAMATIHDPPEKPGELLRRLLAARAKATWTREGEDEPGLWQRRPISPARIHRIHAVIRSALGSAVKRGVLARNPAMTVELPKAPKRRPLVWTPARVAKWKLTGRRPSPVMVWTPEQTGRFLDGAEGDGERLYPLYHLAVTRGLRRGELWGLEWVNVELDVAAGTGWLAVREEEHEVGQEAGERASVKSEAGWRTIPLDRHNVLLLERWRRRQAAERMAADIGDWTESGRVFTAENGSPIRIDFIGDHFDVLVRRYGLPPVRFHDLRHCAATYLLASGADLKVVAETLGHSKFSFTADTYVNVLPDLATAAAEAAVAVIPRRRSTGA